MPVLLASGDAGPGLEEASRWSILCADPFDVIAWSAADGGDPFSRLEAAARGGRDHAAKGLPFAGGAVGYIGFEAGRAVEPSAFKASRGTREPHPLDALPDLLFGLYAWAVVWDHATRTWSIVSTGRPAAGLARRKRAEADLGRLMARLTGPECPTRWAIPGRSSRQAPILGTSVPRPRYLGMVEAARRLIADGQIYQVNLSQRLELPGPAHPAALFTAMAREGPAPFSAYLDTGACAIVSGSPERFLSLKDGVAESRPIKGTRPRGRDAREDRSQREALIASEKDRAENVMILDLIRNDLGRVCRPGTVRPVAVCRPEAYASVHHLVSIVTGDLAEGADRADLIRALFPGGSMTGAPKVRAIQAIGDLEPVPRGVYSGALGYLSFCGSMDLSIVIRTAIVAGGRAWLQVGGGVVWDSDPAAEYAESLDKAAAVRRALAASTARRRAGSGRPARRAARTSRPGSAR